MKNTSLIPTHMPYCSNDPKNSQSEALKELLKESDKLVFSISEITSLEIHSVLGKYRRGSNAQTHVCKRNIILGEGVNASCLNKWTQAKKKKLKTKIYRDILKLISDIEAQRGNILANVLRLNNNAIRIGLNILKKYADQHSVGSHDALIAGALVDRISQTARETKLVTADKNFIKVLKKESIPFVDLKTII